MYRILWHIDLNIQRQTSSKILYSKSIYKELGKLKNKGFPFFIRFSLRIIFFREKDIVLFS